MFKHTVWLSVFSSISLGLVTTIANPTQASTVTFSGSGTLGATNAFNDFSNAIGLANRQRIGWDGVRLDGTDTNPNTQTIDLNKTVAIPIDRFRNNGAIFADPYAVSGDGFASVNPATTGEFPAFSPNNTFVMFDQTPGEFNDRFIEQTFVLPGTNTIAGTRGFGAIFLDVEDPTSSSIEYFGTAQDGSKVSLGKFFVPVGASGEPEFLGVVFDHPVITEVQLTVGTNALFSFDGTSFQSFGAEDLPNGVDLAATDDFLFATPTTPTVTVVPESQPLSLWTVIAVGAMGYLMKRWRQN